MKKIFELAGKYWYFFVIAAVAAVFFIATAGYNSYVHEYHNPSAGQPDFVKWSSPDETANYIFSKLYGQTGQLVVQEDYNLYVQDIMHPRSFRSDHGTMKPVSFLGLPLIYGWLTSFTDYALIPLFTPFFASLGIIVYYLLVKEWLGKQAALLSSVLLAGFPVYIYYTARSMFHNVLFVVLLLAGLLFLLYGLKYARQASGFFDKKIWQKNYISWLFTGLAGLAIGASLSVRTSEAIWVAPVLFLVWIFNIRKWGVLKPVLVVCFILLGLMPMFYWNQVLYGNFYFGGYAEMNSSLLELGKSGGELAITTISGSFGQIRQILSGVLDKIFYFGFHPRDSLAMFQAYFVSMFPWLFWPGVAGLALYYSRLRERTRYDWLFLLSLIVAGSILVLYYGSWNFHDNPDVTQATIGNSYTRYWLPIYLAFMPFAVYGALKLSNWLWDLVNMMRKHIQVMSGVKLRRSTFIWGMVSLLVLGYLFFSVPFVLYGSEEGLVYTAQRHKLMQPEWQKILNATEGNSVIITTYHDKLLFPQRKVIVGLFDDKNMIHFYRQAVLKLPVYYYNFTLPPKDFEYLNNRRLKESGLQIKKVKKITSDFTLYRIKPLTESAPE